MAANPIMGSVVAFVRGLQDGGKEAFIPQAAVTDCFRDAFRRYDYEIQG
jgi:hypothetical protein